MVQRVEYYFNMSRKEVLWGLTLDELYSHHRNAFYFLMESLGKPVKKPTTDQQKEYQKEKMAVLKKRYGIE